MTSPAAIHVARALRMHGLVHFQDAPADGYDCCAEVAIEAYKDYLRITKTDQKSNVVKSSLLN